MSDGTYVVIDLGTGNGVQVNGTSDTNYDLVYYEMPGCGSICMDQVVIGISNDPNGNTYYVVFNWGDGTPDMNTNVGDVAGTEVDNYAIPTSELYGTPPYQNGILIDVDSASSNPPIGLYQYLVLLEVEPANPADDIDGDDGADIDAIQIVEVANPTATPAPMSPNNAPPPPAIDVPADTPPESPPADTPPESPPADTPPESPPADTPPEPPPANEPSAPPANNVPAPPSNDAPAPPSNDAPPADVPPASP